MIEAAKLKDYHNFSSHHYEDILKSEICGCFYCEEMFPPSEIEDWITEGEHNLRGPGKTALCPYCMIDSVLGDGSGIEINAALLRDMKQMWF